MGEKELIVLIGTALIKPASILMTAVEDTKDLLQEIFCMSREDADRLVNTTLDKIREAKEEADKAIAKYESQGKTKEDLIEDLRQERNNQLNSLFDELFNKSN